MNPWRLPRSWRTGSQKWTPEAQILARMFASEGLSVSGVTNRMQMLGIPVSAGTVDNWLHPRRPA